MHSPETPAAAAKNPEEANTSQEPQGYSKAFENLVTEGDDDIVGLLAYALFKQNIREDASRGIKIADLRDPTPVTVKLFRSSAESILGSFAARAIDEARSEIQESAVLSSLKSVQSEITSHVTNRTGMATAVFTNMVAWAATAFLTILIILLLAVGDAGDRFIERIANTLDAAIERSDAGPADPAEQPPAPPISPVQ